MKRDQLGSMGLFMVVFILPLMFFLFTLSLDLTTYYLDADKSQNALDESARYAYRFLPYQAQAEAASRSYAAHFGPLTQGLSVSSTTDWIELKVQRDSPLTFARLFGFTSSSGQPPSIGINVMTRVRGLPFDSMVILDVSPYLAPPVSGLIAWGSQVDWPAAQYMSGAWWFDPQQANTSDRVITQQCFNPVLSALKQATIRTVDYLAGFSLNQVGVGVYTGRNPVPVILIKEIGALHHLPAGAPEQREATFIDGVALYGDNRYCAAAAQEESYAGQYNFPDRESGLPMRRPSSLPQMINPADATLNSEYEDYLEAREVIWSQVVRGEAEGSTPELIQEFYNRLFSAPLLQGRGGLIDKPVKLGVFFAGDVPRYRNQRFGDVNDTLLRQELTIKFQPFIERALVSNSLGKMRLYYVILQNEGVGPLGNLPRDLQRFFDQLIDGQNVSHDRLDVRVIYAADGVQLLEGLLKHLVLTNAVTIQAM